MTSLSRGLSKPKLETNVQVWCHKIPINNFKCQNPTEEYAFEGFILGAWNSSDGDSTNGRNRKISILCTEFIPCTKIATDTDIIGSFKAFCRCEKETRKTIEIGNGNVSMNGIHLLLEVNDSEKDYFTISHVYINGLELKHAFVILLPSIETYSKFNFFRDFAVNLPTDPYLLTLEETEAKHDENYFSTLAGFELNCRRMATAAACHYQQHGSSNVTLTGSLSVFTLIPIVIHASLRVLFLITYLPVFLLNPLHICNNADHSNGNGSTFVIQMRRLLVNLLLAAKKRSMIFVLLFMRVRQLRAFIDYFYFYFDGSKSSSHRRKTRNQLQTSRELYYKKNHALHLLCVLIMDILLGIILGNVVASYHDEIGAAVYKYFGYWLQSQVMRDRISWVMSSHAPMGFKLNEKLDTILGTMVIIIVDTWQAMTVGFSLYANRVMLQLPSIVCYGGGISFLLAFCYDALQILTLHIYILYDLFAKTQKGQVRLLSSLSKLLRGKKKNILRKRVDHCTYDGPQLLTGTILFVVCFFLFQTMLAYYILMTSIWCLVLIAQSVLWLLLCLLKHLPIFSLILVTREQSSILHTLPCGINLKIVENKSNNISTLIVQSKSCTFPFVFLAWVRYCLAKFKDSYLSKIEDGILRSLVFGGRLGTPPVSEI